MPRPHFVSLVLILGIIFLLPCITKAAPKPEEEPKPEEYDDYSDYIDWSSLFNRRNRPAITQVWFENF